MTTTLAKYGCSVCYLPEDHKCKNCNRYFCNSCGPAFHRSQTHEFVREDIIPRPDPYDLSTYLECTKCQSRVPSVYKACVYCKHPELKTYEMKPAPVLTPEQVAEYEAKYEDYENKWECDFCFTRMPQTDEKCSFCKKDRKEHYVNTLAHKAKLAMRENLKKSRIIDNLVARRNQLATVTYPLQLALKLNDGVPPASDAEFQGLLKAQFNRWPGKGTYLEEEFAVAMTRSTFNVAEHVCSVNRATITKIMGTFPPALRDLWKPLVAQYGANSLQQLLVKENQALLTEVGAFKPPRDADVASDFFLKDLSGERPEVVEAVIRGELVGQPHMQTLVKLVNDSSTFEEVSIGDIQIALLKLGPQFDACKAYLTAKCPICDSTYPQHMVHVGKAVCKCTICFAHYDDNLQKIIRDRAPTKWRCGGCGIPVDPAKDDALLMKLVEEMRERVQQLQKEKGGPWNITLQTFSNKVMNYERRKNPNAVECVKCNHWTIAKPNENPVRCEGCQAQFCRKCNNEWHQGKTCLEAFQMQHPDMEMIQCPKCGHIMEKVLGRCEHFDCINTNCGVPFCPCGSRFYNGSECESFRDVCAGSGFHGHHPRNCYTYLRDMEVYELERLLTLHKVSYNKQCPATAKCTVVVVDKNNKEGPCNVEVHQRGLDVCKRHYIAFLANLVQERQLDPVDVYTAEEITILCKSTGVNIPVPPVQVNENENAYRNRLAQIVKNSWPLNKAFP